MRLTLINHACVKIETQGMGLLCDPWIEGAAFNDGWRLLAPTRLSRADIMAGVSHIWLSHEHPDHFSPAFLAAIAGDYAGRVEVLFQKTRDGRVRRFCESKGYRVREVAPDEVLSIGAARLRVGPVAPYDSWLWCSDGAQSLLNLNDCPISSPSELALLRRRLGAPDVLLTQFSYAAWKGGRDNQAFRRAAAQEKLATVRVQAAATGARAVIPFASFAYFAHDENAYLNSGANQPGDAVEGIVAAGSRPVVLFPGDSWTVGAAHDNGPALAAFDALYAAVPTLPRVPQAAPVALPELERRFAAWRGRVLAQNSALLMRIVRRLPVMRAFAPVAIRLTDLNETVRVSPIDGFSPTDQRPDVEMSSASLAFIFDHDFGFDTLTVNGRFEATPEGFSRLTRTFGVGSLNAMGVRFSWSLLFHGQVMARLLRTLWRVTARLRQAEPARA
jgi:hypothetical protein